MRQIGQQILLRLLAVVDEMAPRPIGAEARAVERATKLSFVLRMSRHTPEFFHPVSELALVAVLAGTVLLERPAQLGLVPTGVGLNRSPVRFTGAAFQLPGLAAVLGFARLLLLVVLGERWTTRVSPMIGILMTVVIVIVVVIVVVIHR